MLDPMEWNEGVRLVGLRKPEPSRHPDRRMRMTLRDCEMFYTASRDREKEQASLFAPPKPMNDFGDI